MNTAKDWACCHNTWHQWHVSCGLCTHEHKLVWKRMCCVLAHFHVLYRLPITIWQGRMGSKRTRWLQDFESSFCKQRYGYASHVVMACLVELTSSVSISEISVQVRSKIMKTISSLRKKSRLCIYIYTPLCPTEEPQNSLHALHGHISSGFLCSINLLRHTKQSMDLHIFNLGKIANVSSKQFPDNLLILALNQNHCH